MYCEDDVTAKQDGYTESWAAAWHCSTHFNCVCEFTYLTTTELSFCLGGMHVTVVILQISFISDMNMMAAYGCNLLDLLHELRVHTMNVSASHSTEHAIVTCFMVFSSVKFRKFRHTCRNRWTGLYKCLDFRMETLNPVGCPLFHMLRLLSGKLHPHSTSRVGPVFFKIFQKLLWCLLSKFCKGIIIAVLCSRVHKVLAQVLQLFFFFFSFSWEIARLAILCFNDFRTWKRHRKTSVSGHSSRRTATSLKSLSTIKSFVYVVDEFSSLNLERKRRSVSWRSFLSKA